MPSKKEMLIARMRKRRITIYGVSGNDFRLPA